MPINLQNIEGLDVSDAGTAMKDGDAGLAVRIYGNLIPHSSDPRLYLVRGLALSLLAKSKEAEEDFRQYRELTDGIARPINLYVGTALWMQGLRHEACEDWHNEMIFCRERHIKYGALMGIEYALMLWWASCHSELSDWHEVATKRVKAIKKTKAFLRYLNLKSHWSAPIGLYVMNEMSSEEVFAYLSSNSSLERQIARAPFYFAGRALMVGDSEKYLDDLRLSLESQATYWQPEYHIARYEINRTRIG